MPLFDIDGDPRVIGPAPDMGADEFEALVGSREDFVMSLAVNGTFAPAIASTPAVAGDLLSISISSPGATMNNTFAVLLAEPWLPPTGPLGTPGFPELHLPLGAMWLAAYPTGVSAAGVTLATPIPTGLTGFSFRCQAITLTPAAKNGLFAATAARDLVLSRSTCLFLDSCSCR
jgi:hypothetical protein